MSALASGVEVDSRAVDDLATSFGGSLIRPDDTTYDEQRKYDPNNFFRLNQNIPPD